MVFILSLIPQILRASPASRYGYLRWPDGARSAAMGGLTPPPDRFSGSTRRTLLGGLALRGTAFQTTQGLADLGVSWGEISVTHGSEAGSFTLSGLYLNSGQITRTLENSVGGFAGEEGKFSVTGFSVGASWSRAFGKKAEQGKFGSPLSGIGVGLRTIFEDNPDAKGSGLGLDLGLRYVPKGLSSALTVSGHVIPLIQSGGSVPTSIEATWDEPFVIGKATGWVVLGAELMGNGSFLSRLGLEFEAWKWARLRAGKSFNEDRSGLAGLSMGIGISLTLLDFDYALVMDGPLGKRHFVSLSYGVRKASRDPDSDYVLAYRIYKEGNFKEAYRLLKNVARFRRTAEIFQMAGNASYRVDKPKEALEWYQKALELAPDNKDLQEWVQRLSIQVGQDGAQ